jgi:carbamate kinase
MNSDKIAVVALGGNAITRKGVADTIANQFSHTRESLSAIIPLVKDGYHLAIAHGNGPQVGNAIFRVELARGKAPILPLGICVADTEGGMGYMIEQSLQNRLHREKIRRRVLTIVTQVIVGRDDPSVNNPTKFIGQFYTKEEALKFRTDRDWVVKPDGDRGWRRVVPSPKPLSIVEAESIKALVHQGHIVIAAGGGGIPVYIEDDGTYEGMDAVIDKDRASAVLAREIGASLLVILTDVERVALHYGKPEQQSLDTVTVSIARDYLAQGHFPAGSMGPKIEAAINFIEGGGRQVLISSIDKAAGAIAGKTGTRIVPD